MRAVAVALTAAFASASPMAGSAQSVSAPVASSALRDSSRAALLRDIGYLASPALGGRAIGSTGLDSAAEYLARQYAALQIDPLLTGGACDSAGPCRRSYFQTFAPPKHLLAMAGVDTLSLAYNVVAVVQGTDPTVGGQWIVIGAHYDHLGVTGMGALDRRTAKLPHLGADDNASGTAAVLELARRLANDPPRRSVLFVHFAAEEIGLIGSTVFVNSPPVALDAITAMFNLDMVGMLGRRSLQLLGLESSPDWKELIQRANVAPRLPVTEGRVVGGSDHMPFARAGVPVVHFFTGIHPAYHTKDDTVQGLDIEGMLSVIDLAERLVRIVANDDARPRRVAPR